VGQVRVQALLGLLKAWRKEGEHGQQWPINLSSVSPNPLGLASTVVNADMMQGKLSP